jgi:hypothetical protein
LGEQYRILEWSIQVGHECVIKVALIAVATSETKVESEARMRIQKWKE